MRRPDRLPLAYCAECALWYVCGLPRGCSLELLYDGYWKNTRPSDLSLTAVRQLEKTATANRTVDIRLQRIAVLLGGLEGRCLLDVGCGLGQLLVAARAEGAQVIGNDVSPEACRFIRSLGFEALEGPLQRFASSIAPVDVVVMSDLIEHPQEPGVLLESARSILKPGGLLVLWTPNGGAAGESAATAREWVGFRVDLEHMQYFSTQTISCLARRLGWRIEHLETLGHPDLQDVERLSAGCQEEPSPGLRETLKKVPGAVFAARLARSFLQRAFPVRPSPHARFARDGCYHLFAILRRPKDLSIAEANP